MVSAHSTVIGPDTQTATAQENGELTASPAVVNASGHQTRVACGRTVSIAAKLRSAEAGSAEEMICTPVFRVARK
jgi:hypothetical protein